MITLVTVGGGVCPIVGGIVVGEGITVWVKVIVEVTLASLATVGAVVAVAVSAISASGVKVNVGSSGSALVLMGVISGIVIGVLVCGNCVLCNAV